jgi:hypothetical protein
LLDQHPPHGGGLDFRADLTDGAKISQDQRDRHISMLATDVTEQFSELWVELLTAAAIASPSGPKRLKATAAQRVDPALERRDAEGASVVVVGKAEALLGQATQLLHELSAVEGLQRKGTDEAVAK